MIHTPRGVAIPHIPAMLGHEWGGIIVSDESDRPETSRISGSKLRIGWHYSWSGWSQNMSFYPEIHSWLVVTGCHVLFSHMTWVSVIIPIDEVIFFRYVSGFSLINQPFWGSPILGNHQPDSFWPVVSFGDQIAHDIPFPSYKTPPTGPWSQWKVEIFPVPQKTHGFRMNGGGVPVWTENFGDSGFSTSFVAKFAVVPSRWDIFKHQNSDQIYVTVIEDLGIWGSISSLVGGNWLPWILVSHTHMLHVWNIYLHLP